MWQWIVFKRILQLQKKKKLSEFWAFWLQPHERLLDSDAFEFVICRRYIGKFVKRKNKTNAYMKLWNI